MRSPLLNQKAQCIFHWAEENGVTLVPQFVMGKRNVSGVSQSVQSDDWVRVVSEQPGVPGPSEEVPTSLNSQQEAPSVLLSSCRSMILQLQIYAFPVCHGEVCNQQTKDVNWGRDDSHHSVLEAEGVVPRSSGVACGASAVPASTEGPVVPASLLLVLLQSLHASVDCMETLQRFARHQDFSRGAARQLSLSRCESTHVNCQCNWKVHRSCCRANDHSSSRPSVPKLTEFFIFVCRVKGFWSQLSRVTGLCWVVFLELFLLRYLCLCDCMTSLNCLRLSFMLCLFVFRQGIWRWFYGPCVVRNKS